MKEVWKDIKGFEGIYQVSDKKNVRNVKTGRLRTIVLMHKYYSVTLYKNNKAKTCSLHRLLAEAFIPNPDNLPCVGHWDDNPLNNDLSNLYWTTHKENNNHGKHNERLREAKKNKGRVKKVFQYTLDGIFVGEYPSVREVERQTGFSSSSIASCCRNRLYYKTAYGFIWRYGKQRENYL